MEKETHQSIDKPVEQHQTWGELAIIWAGSAVAISGFIVGGSLATGSSFWNAILMAAIGYAILTILMIYQGYQGSDQGRTAVDIASQVFGEEGSQKVISIILVISCLGWFGIQTNIVGQTFSNFLAGFGLNIPVWLSSLIWGAIMLFTAVYGIEMISLLGKIAVPVLGIVVAWVTINVFGEFGLSSITDYQSSGISFTQGVSTVVGSLAVGTVIAPDYFRYTPKRSNVTKSAWVGIFPAGVLMIAVGAYLTLATGSADISQIFMDYSTPIFGLLAILAATWTTNVTNAYSGGVAFAKILGWDEKYENRAVLIAGSVGILLAIIGILDYFTPIMNLLTALIPPIAGVMIASYYVSNQGDPHQWAPVKGWNWLGVWSWLIGAVPAAIPVIANFFGIALSSNPLIGMVLSFFAHIILVKFFGKKLEQSIVKESE
jgi:cytosine permease